MKQIGALLLLGAVLGIVLCLGALERKKGRELSSLLSLLEGIRNGMLYERLPLLAIYERLSLPTLAENGFMEEARHSGLFSALTSGLLTVSDTDLSFLFTYAESLGRRFADEEIQETETAIAKLSLLIERHKTEGAKKHKLQKTLIATGGGMVLLLLL